MTRTERKLRQDAKTIFARALSAADAEYAVRSHLSLGRGVILAGNVKLPFRHFDRVFLLAVGKASVAMAAAVETILGARLTGGIVVTKHGHLTAELKRLQIMEAGHPVPDETGLAASAQVVDLLRELNARDLLIVTISGGASALLPAPAEPITLREKGKVTGLLLRAGATIHELNAVRKHISSLKGGQLAALAYPATVVSLLLSDVVGDRIDVIGSGPTAPDISTFADAIQILKHYKLDSRVPQRVLARLEQGAAGLLPETPKPGDSLFRNVHNQIIGNNRFALKAAALQAKKLGYAPMILSSTMEGETREVARVHAEVLREASMSKSPVCLLSGGETTVTVNGQGKGGRNQEFALAAAIALDGLKDVLILSAGTDGTDGPTDAAGAIALGDTVRRAKAAGLDAYEHLQDNNAYPFFDALGDLVKTGPTGTNVMDIHLLLTDCKN
ncbi:MAG: glycerate kinase [Acidobacteriaceae bacterium]|nr:glycerate kinase [Acidobacteriaceae bacterium]